MRLLKIKNKKGEGGTPIFLIVSLALLVILFVVVIVGYSTGVFKPAFERLKGLSYEGIIMIKKLVGIGGKAATFCSDRSIEGVGEGEFCISQSECTINLSDQQYFRMNFKKGREVPSFEELKQGKWETALANGPNIEKERIIFLGIKNIIDNLKITINKKEYKVSVGGFPGYSISIGVIKYGYGKDNKLWVYSGGKWMEQDTSLTYYKEEILPAFQSFANNLPVVDLGELGKSPLHLQTNEEFPDYFNLQGVQDSDKGRYSFLWGTFINAPENLRSYGVDSYGNSYMHTTYDGAEEEWTAGYSEYNTDEAFIERSYFLEKISDFLWENCK